jgi:hypothetical protein
MQNIFAPLRKGDGVEANYLMNVSGNLVSANTRCATIKVTDTLGRNAAAFLTARKAEAAPSVGTKIFMGRHLE